MPLSVSELERPSLAVIVWSRAVTWPCVAGCAPPRPRALPMATTVSPTRNDDESAKVTVGRPDTVASVLFDEPGLGVTCLIGAWVGGAVACATGCEPLTARARLQPMPAPPAAATTAMSTRKAATRFHIESAGAVVGGGVHVGGGGVASFDGGSKLWSGGVSGPCSDPPGFCSDIFDLPPLATWNSDVVLRGCARDLGTDSMNP